MPTPTRNWHTVAARVAAEHPYWSWSQVCAHVAKLSPRRKKKPVAPDAGHVERMEKRGLW